jgi:hypothetical protein
LVVHKTVLQEYKNRITEGRYNLSDRKGKSLSSGGDLQIVLTATNMGLPVGTIGQMKISHLIVSHKSTISYLVKQVYGTSSSYVAAHNQVDGNIKIDKKLVTDFEIVRKFVFLVRVHLFRTGLNEFKLIIADFFGSINARYVYSENFKKPLLIRIYEKIINA